MSFYTSLTGLNAATSQLSVTSNNIANVGTTGFKRSRADFGDIFATSPLQKASSVVGQGTALKQVSQEFSQGNIQFSANSLDIAITGDGFFPLKSADGLQDIYTRNGTFLLNDSYAVVNGSGQALIAASVDSSGKADLDNLSKLIIPRSTTGDAVATTDIQLGLNLPADAKIPTLPFDKNDPTTYNKTTAITVYDAGGNDYLATVYYRKTQVAKPEDPSNKWQTFVYIGDTKLQELLIQSKDKAGEAQFVNKYGEVRSESDIPPQDIARGVTKLFNLDDLKNPIASTPATAKSASPLPVPLVNEWKNGIDFPDRVNAWFDTNPTKGAVFSDVNAQRYFLNTRATIADETAAQQTALTKLVFEPEERGNILKLTIGTNAYVGADLDDLVAKVNAGSQYTATNVAGKLTVQLTGNSGDPTEIDEDYELSVFAANAVDSADIIESTSGGNITQLLIPVSDADESYAIEIGGEIFSGATLEDLKAAIDADGQYAAALNKATIAGPSFGNPAATTDFTNFSITIDGVVRAITPAPTAATLAALAADLNTQLSALDPTMSVALVNGNIVATSSDADVRISAMSLTAVAGADAGTDGGSQLTIQLGTASEINPNYSFISGVNGTPSAETAKTQKITELTFAIDAGTGATDPGMQSLVLTIGNDTFTGEDVATLEENINRAGKYTATLDTTANTLVVGLTGESGDPTLINSSYKLSHITGSLQADTMADLASEINVDETLDYEASVNAAGQLVLKPKDGVNPFVIPEFSMTASFADGFEIRPESKTTSSMSYKVEYLSDTFTLDLGSERYQGVSIDELVDEINGVSQVSADAADFTETLTGGDITTLRVAVSSDVKDLTMVFGAAPNDLTFTGYDIASLISAINADGTYTAVATSSGMTIERGTATEIDATYSLDYLSKDTNRIYDATTTGNSDGSTTITINAYGTGATIPSISSLTASSLGVQTGADDIVFDLNVDGSATPITVDLSYLKDLTTTKKYTGIEIAREITNTINKSYGDQRYFDFTAFKPTEDSTEADMFRLTVGGVSKPIVLTEGQFGIKDLSAVTLQDAISAIQAVVDKEVEFPSPVTVGYDPVRQTFTFKPDDEVDVSIRSFTTSRNDLFGLSDVESTIDPDTGTWGKSVLPNGSMIVSAEDQRYGVEVKFDETTGEFTISSGTTGDTSSISISKASALANYLFGFVQGDTATEVDTSSTPLRGITSTPAELKGNAIGINLDNKFRVDGSNNQFVVTVDNVTGLITMPEKTDYTMEEFRQALEDRVNALADNFGRTVNGVKLDIVTNPGTNTKSFVFKTGTTGDDSFLKVSANSIWGLDGLPSARGSTSRWIEPPQAQNADGFPLYVDRDGLETSDPGTFSEDETRDLWSPIFLDKGELTFDTAGNLKSPLEAIAFKSTTIGDSGATLQFSIDYVSSTQYSSPFSVLKQDQNGRPEGDLIGVDIGDDGLVSASYSNGSQKSLAKIVLVNFASPTGLRQIGDASYYATSKSGDAKYGEAGSAGFGTVRAGARERANVDLTNELIELITAQRNFQANAKAIETNNTLTQAIINIRS
jgi:flagellar hook-basal body protein